MDVVEGEIDGTKIDRLILSSAEWVRDNVDFDLSELEDLPFAAMPSEVQNNPSSDFRRKWERREYGDWPLLGLRTVYLDNLNDDDYFTEDKRWWTILPDEDVCVVVANCRCLSP